LQDLEVVRGVLERLLDVLVELGAMSPMSCFTSIARMLIAPRCSCSAVVGVDGRDVSCSGSS
jgi:hypothetical protein